MAKPDWGDLQQRFLSDHAATGVSPKDWCESQGLNYTYARRYIKKPTAQKTAQKEVRNAQAEPAPQLRSMSNTQLMRRAMRKKPHNP